MLIGRAGGEDSRLEAVVSIHKLNATVEIRLLPNLCLKTSTEGDPQGGSFVRGHSDLIPGCLPYGHETLRRTPHYDG